MFLPLDLSWELSFTSRNHYSIISCRQLLLLKCIGLVAICVISYLYIHVYIFKHDYSRLIFMYTININQNNAQIQIFRWFQKLGWCKGIKRDSYCSGPLVCKEFDTKIKTWKHCVEVTLIFH